MAPASVRAATSADVDEIIRVQASTWRTAYAELVGEAALQRLSGPAARQAWDAAVTAGAGSHVWVATEGRWTVGFCAATRASDPDSDPDSSDGATPGQVATRAIDNTVTDQLPTSARNSDSWRLGLTFGRDTGYDMSRDRSRRWATRAGASAVRGRVSSADQAGAHR